MMNDNFLDTFKNKILESDIDVVGDKNTVLEKIEQIKKQKINIMFVGATGAGKSSTINAIFDMEIAKVGYSVNPETSTIEKYELDNMILWDTPGLGDDPEKDKVYAIQIANALKLKDSDGNLLIDEVVVVIDGSNRDMKTSYEIIEHIIVPYIGDTNRIVVAVNQCDMAMKGNNWDSSCNQPTEPLVAFLEEKISSVATRLEDSTGIRTLPIYYSALNSYNISKLLLTIIKSIPAKKRFLFADSLNKNPEVWKKNDKIQDYNVEIKEEIKWSLSKAIDGAVHGAAAGKQVGEIIPKIGPVVGAAVGAVLGFLGGLFEG